MPRRRREFTRDVRAEIVRRATKDGVVRCETCGVAAKRWEVDHTDPDGMQVDKSRRLTAAEGLVLCAGPNSCHADKTAKDVADIAKAKRVEAGNLRIKTAPAQAIKGAPFAKSPKAAARAAAGPKNRLPPRLLPGWVPATERKS